MLLSLSLSNHPLDSSWSNSAATSIVERCWWLQKKRATEREAGSERANWNWAKDLLAEAGMKERGKQDEWVEDINHSRDISYHKK